MQETNFYTMTIPPMRKMLVNLSAILDKAYEHGKTKATERQSADMRAEALLNARLVFDQFDLKRQIQVAADNAKNGAARLAGVEAPKFEDSEKTVHELKERIQKTVAFLDSIKPEQVIGQEARRIVLPYSPKEMTAFGYASEYLLPNFYFHAVTAYAILRHNGVDLGKSDYIGAMPYLD